MLDAASLIPDAIIMAIIPFMVADEFLSTAVQEIETISIPVASCDADHALLDKGGLDVLRKNHCSHQLAL
jgi:hypothetical protein